MQSEIASVGAGTIPRRQRNTGPLPSFEQERLVFLQQFDPESWHYNMNLALRLKGPLRVDVLEQALDDVVARHDVLRTSFVMVDDVLTQVINPEPACALPIVDLSDGSRAGTDLERRDAVLREARRPFNLSDGPAIRAVLFRFAPDDHLFVATIHHVVCDAWSMEVFGRELAQCYNTRRAGQRPILRDLPIQYSDYAAWQRSEEQEPAREEDVAYWCQHLAGVPVLELPTLRSRPPVQQHVGATVQVDLPDQLAAPLRELARRERTTLFMTALAAFSVLLSRYTGQTDLVIGTPISGRGRVELEQLVGFFLNTVALRMDVSGNPTFLEVLRRARQVAVGAYSHPGAPFARLVSELLSGRDLSRTPLFQVMLVVEHLGEESWALDGLTVTRERLDTAIAKFDLTLFVREHAGRIRIAVEYSSALFDDAYASRLAAHFVSILRQVVTDPTRTVDELELLSPDERRQIVETWNTTTPTHADDSGVQEWFERQVAKTPTAVAVISATDQVSYQELNRRANQLAREIMDRGGARGRVAICVDRSVEMVVAVLAALKAGAAYVPLDPAYPDARLQFMVEDADAAVVIAQTHWQHRLPSSAPIVWLDRDGGRLARHADDNLGLSVTPEDVVYITYTSGSTGTPKGIALPQRSLANLLMWHWTTLGAGATTLQYASLGFDASFHEIFSTLCSGGQLVLMSEGSRQDVTVLIETLEQRHVERLILPSVVLDQLAQECNRTERHLPAVKDVIVTGEQLQITESVREFFTEAHCALHNHYGPAETHVVTAYTLTGPPRAWPSRPPIGRPIANTQIYVVDRRGAPTPIGVAGELQIGGVSLAHGYWRRPELTATQFVADRFSAQPGARLYRTGDLARWLPDGTLEFLGRRDHQVKVRGHRVELGEIEAVLTQHVAVHQAVVVARTATNDDVRLTAYVVPHGEAPALAETLRAHLQSLLPDYMWPTQVVLLTTLPVTAHGKVDRQALPIPDEREPSHAYEPPRTETEVRLAGIWADVLGVARVGIHDNFFDLGGHSLLAMRVVNRVRQVFQRPVEVAALFRSPTVSEFGILLDRLDLSPVSPSMTLTPVLSKVGLPLTINQEKRLMFDECLRLGRQSPQPFNVAMCLRFDGLLDIDALEGALQRIVSRHDILRARFTPVATTMVPQYERYQRLTDFWKTGRFAPGLFTYSIAPVEAIAVRLEHVRTLGDGPLDVALDTVVRGAVQAYIATNDPPLIRALLIETDPQIHLLILTMPHLISDGRTLEVIKGELRDTYHRLASGTPVAMSVPPYQMADFAVFQHAYLKGEAVHAAVEYWSTHWSEYGHARLRLSDFPRLRETAGGVEQEKPSRRLRLSKSVTDDIRRCARHANTTLYMFFLATFYLALYRHTRKPRVALWANCENRTRPEFSNVVGWFVNSHLLGISFESDPTCAELLSQVQRLVLEATKHQDLPTTALWTMLGTSPDVDELQVFFEFKRQSERCGSERSGMDIQEVRLPLMSSTVFARHFFVMVTEDGPEIELAFGFSSSSVDEEGMRQWLDDWAALSRSMPAMLETRLSQFL